MSPYTGIHHVAFATGDIQATVAFWRDLLGLRLVYAYGKPGYRQYFFEISGNSRVSFFEWPEVQKVPYRHHGTPAKGPFHYDHISIGVNTKQDLWDILARLDSAGFPASDVIDHGCFLSLYSFDPNGIPIEFSCNVPGTNIWWDPLMRDACALDTPHLCEPDPLPGRWPRAEPIPEDERIIVVGEGKELFPDARP
ncbi:MAG: VOC family protein [Magnetococcus sp. WYHC-3]